MSNEDEDTAMTEGSFIRFDDIRKADENTLDHIWAIDVY